MVTVFFFALHNFMHLRLYVKILYICLAQICNHVFFQPSLVEEYFEAHSSSKVLTSDRTLQKLQTPKLDRVSSVQRPTFNPASRFLQHLYDGNFYCVLQETLLRLLDGKPSCYTHEITQLNKKHEKNFSKWMLQLQLS